MRNGKMKKHTETILSEAIDLVSGVDHVLCNTQTHFQLNSKNCYDFAERLERAYHMLLVVGDRKYQQEINQLEKVS
jgi:hypothetical protein